MSRRGALTLPPGATIVPAAALAELDAETRGRLLADLVTRQAPADAYLGDLEADIDRLYALLRRGELLLLHHAPQGRGEGPEGPSATDEGLDAEESSFSLIEAC